MKKLALLLVLFIPVLAFSQIINIPGDYPSIQEGINAASNGDTVLVRADTYFENINFNGKNITLASHYLMTLDTSIISLTVINGDDAGSVVTFNTGEDSTAILCGFTITNGWKMNDGGGGVFCSGASPTLSNLLIKNNEVRCMYKNNSIGKLTGAYGGGIYFEYSSSFIKDVVIIGNQAAGGGGIYCLESDLHIQNASITNNSGIGCGAPRDGGWGGGIGCMMSTLNLKNVSINLNEVTGNSRGGGIASSGSITNLVNCRLKSNNAAAGHSIWSFGDSSLSLSNVLLMNSIEAIEVREGVAEFTNTTFINNNIGILLGHNNIILIQNSIFWNNNSNAVKVRNGFHDNDISIKYSTVEEGIDGINTNNGGELHWLDGNIDQDPLFIGCGEHPYQINDYSPCIDAGTPDTTGLNLHENDLAGEVRIFNDRIDMGAYEWNTFVDVEEFEVQSLRSGVSSFPNPFSTSTTIEYELSRPETVTISFYNQFGKQVDLFEESQQKGLNKVVWTPNKLPNGIYYFSLKANKQVGSGKVVLIR